MILPHGAYIPPNRHLLGNVGVGGSGFQQGVAPQQAMTTAASRGLVPVVPQAMAGAARTVMTKNGTDAHAIRQRMQGQASEVLQQGEGGARVLLNHVKSALLPRDGYMAALGQMLRAAA